jgi:hypothetical protein
LLLLLVVAEAALDAAVDKRPILRESFLRSNLPEEVVMSPAPLTEVLPFLVEDEYLLLLLLLEEVPVELSMKPFSPDRFFHSDSRLGRRMFSR